MHRLQPFDGLSHLLTPRPAVPGDENRTGTPAREDRGVGRGQEWRRVDEHDVGLALQFTQDRWHLARREELAGVARRRSSRKHGQ
jgi:hypothetical protein